MKAIFVFVLIDFHILLCWVFIVSIFLNGCFGFISGVYFKTTSYYNYFWTTIATYEINKCTFFQAIKTIHNEQLFFNSILFRRMAGNLLELITIKKDGLQLEIFEALLVSHLQHQLIRKILIIHFVQITIYVVIDLM